MGRLLSSSLIVFSLAIHLVDQVSAGHDDTRDICVALDKGDLSEVHVLDNEGGS